MTSGLPLCPLTDLPRVMCGCPRHNDSFTMTPEEREFLESSAPEGDSPTAPPPLRQVVLDHRSQRWHAAPSVGGCDHGKPEGASLCPDCENRLHGWLADVAALVAELEITLTKQDVLADYGRVLEADPDEGLMPWKEGASRAIRGLWAALDGRPAPTAVAMLQRWREVLRGPHVAELYGRVGYAVAQAHQQIERRVPRMYYGLCPNCGEAIYQERIKPDADPPGQVECRCGYRNTLVKHQAAQLDLAEAREFTITELVRVLNDGGEPVQHHEIDNLIYRHTEGVIPGRRDLRPKWQQGRLVQKWVTVYRLGHVRAALLAKRIRRTG